MVWSSFPFVLPLAAALLLTLSACGDGETVDEESQASTSSALSVGPDRFAETVRDPGTVVLNVHTPDEGSIPGTDLAIPFDRLRARTDELPTDHTAALALYCMTDTMSQTAVTTLTEMGYRDLTELRGGMQAWEESGHPLIGAADR